MIAQREDVFQLVNLQRSVASKKDLLILTLNLGVYSIPLAVKEREAGLFALSMGIWSCHWRERIGFLLPEHNDKWWRLSHDADTPRVEDELLYGVLHTYLCQTQTENQHRQKEENDAPVRATHLRQVRPEYRGLGH